MKYLDGVPLKYYWCPYWQTSKDRDHRLPNMTFCFTPNKYWNRSHITPWKVYRLRMNGFCKDINLTETYSGNEFFYLSPSFRCKQHLLRALTISDRLPLIDFGVKVRANSSAPKIEQTTISAAIFSKTAGKVRKYLKKRCLFWPSGQFFLFRRSRWICRRQKRKLK